MADVTVEFGAKDVGLEKVLTQIREESERLKNSLKGTELGMEDIESIMRKIGKNDSMEKRIRSLGGAMDETKAKTEKFANSGSLVKDFATGIAFTGIVAGARELMNEFDRIGDLAVRFNTSAETIQKVGVAAKMSGTDIEAVAGAMTKAGIAATNAADNGGEMAEKFKLAGIDAREFSEADLDKKLIMIAQAYQDAAGDASKLNAIISIMGSKGGANLIPLISNVDELRATMAGASVATNESVASIQKANDAIDEMTQTLKVWGAEVVGFLVDNVQAAGERVGNILAGGVGKTIKELDADIDRLTAKARLAEKGVKAPSEDKSIKGTGMGGEATGAQDLLNTMVASIAGPINDIVTGTTNFRDKQNADAAIAAQNIDPNAAADYEKQIADEIAAMKEEAAAKEKATAEKVANDKIAAIEKVKLAEMNASKDAPQVQAVLKILGTDSVEDAKAALKGIAESNGESVTVQLKAAGVEGIDKAKATLDSLNIPQVNAVLKVLGTDDAAYAKDNLKALAFLDGETITTNLKAEGIDNIDMAQAALDSLYAPEVLATLDVLGTNNIHTARLLIDQLAESNGESVTVQLKAEGIEGIANAQNILNQVVKDASLMTMTSEYSANLEGIAATAGETNSFLQEQTSILEENLNLTGSLSESTDDQNEYLGDQAKQLEIVKGLYEDINTEENEAQKKYREKAEEKAKDDQEKAQKKVEKESEDASQKAQQEYDSSLTGQAYNRIDAAKKEFKVTAGGRLSEGMNKALSEGRFGAAENYANQIARRESAYEEKQVSRMVKDKGMTRSEAEDSVRSTKQQNDPMGTLVKYTEEIKKSVSNIDKNLPQKALTA